MERFLQHYNKERLKMAMLKQEETFINQVNELHRLYHVQKTLMGDLKHQQKQKQQQKKKKKRQQEESKDVDLTLAIGSSIRNREGKEEKEEEGTSDSGGTSQFSSSSTETMGETLKLYEWGRFQVPDMNVRYDRTEEKITSWHEDLDLCLVRS